LSHGDGRGAQVLHEKPAQVSFADAEPVGESLDARIVSVQRAFRD
jgi:hypothetical protein